MVGETLRGLRSRIEGLAVEDGPYVVMCGRTGDRPVPLDDARFRDRATANEAVALAERYRVALRRYDPAVRPYDPIVCETVSSAPEAPCRAVTDGGSIPASEPGGFADRVEFCHAVVGALFEALAATGHGEVERTILEAYFDAAEDTPERDVLCLALLERMAVEIEARLDDSAQATVLEVAARRLPSPAPTDDPIRATLDHVESIGLLDSYTTSPWVEGASGRRHCKVTIAGYALGPSETVLPTLPVSVDVMRRRAGTPPAVVSASPIGDDMWQFTVAAESPNDPAGLAAAPIAEP